MLRIFLILIVSFLNYNINNSFYYYIMEKNVKNCFKTTVVKYDIILTTYSMLTIDHTLFKCINWHIICLDEAQHIKNAQTKRANNIRSLNSEGRVAFINQNNY